MFTEGQGRDACSQRRRTRWASAALCCVAGLILGQATATGQSLLTDLGPGTAMGLNDSGQVVLQNGVWSAGTITLFPTDFTGTAINSSGMVAGGLTGPNIVLACATYSNGTITDLGVLSGQPDVDTCNATGINASGQVVGWSETRGGSSIEAIISTNGAMLGIGGIHCPCTQLVSEGFGINDAGQITGFAQNDNLNVVNDAFIYDSTTKVLTDLGAGEGRAINASGQVVGSNAKGGVIYSNGMTTQIPLLGVAINTTGEVVGGAFFYSGGLVDLNDLVSATDPLKPFVTLSSAVGINDNRLIAVNGTDSRTQIMHAYLVQGPFIDITPGPLTYPNQAIGTVSSAQTLTVTNAGTVPLPLDRISTSGDFSQTNDCGTALAPSARCAVLVTFGPTAGGRQDRYIDRRVCRRAR